MTKIAKTKAVKTLIELAEQQGNLSVGDIKKHIPDIQDSKEELNGWIALFRSMKIIVVSCYTETKTRKKTKKK